MTNPQSDRQAIRVQIQGRVQGVGYRCATQEQADRRGLGGWVRNLANGDVEAWFEGDPAGVSQMVQWCYQGPPAAQVTNLVYEEMAIQGYRKFQIRRSV